MALAALAQQEGSVSGDAHQHVLGLQAAQAGVVPPVRDEGVSRASCRGRRRPPPPTPCSRGRWAEERGSPASAQTGCSAAACPGSGSSGRTGCRTPGCQSGRSEWSRTLGGSGSDSAGLDPSALRRTQQTLRTPPETRLCCGAGYVPEGEGVVSYKGLALPHQEGAIFGPALTVVLQELLGHLPTIAASAQLPVEPALCTVLLIVVAFLGSPEDRGGTEPAFSQHLYHHLHPLATSFASSSSSWSAVW